MLHSEMEKGLDLQDRPKRPREAGRWRFRMVPLN